ncbi:hypothetical protein WJT86_12275, partial [Microvirga sp. W0021]
RDLSQAQVITKDESYGVEFYASNSGLNAITNPAQYYKDVTEGFQRQLNQLGALGNSAAGAFAEAARNGSLNDETIARIKAECGVSVGSNQFNILEFFVTTAHAQVPCRVPIGGTVYYLEGKDVADCIRIIEEYRNRYGPGVFANSYDNFLRTVGLSPAEAGLQYKTQQDVYNRQAILGNRSIVDGGVMPAEYYDSTTGQWTPISTNTGQYYYVNPNTGAAVLYNPNAKST